ncbi:MAG: hypothetical protein HYZ89_02305 [Candidatus Omnitrophica bacterium]|nr:hypothetical protein [Candidatus Omnitrophota bacterium]
MSVVLEREYKVFKDHHAELLAKGEGKFALVKGDTISDIFTSYEDALKEGLRRFGDVPFLIHEIQREEDVQFFYAYLLR